MKTRLQATPINISKWMPLWIADMRRETNSQSLEFHAMYLNLLMAAWENNGQLPDDEEQLARISRADGRQWLKHRQSLANLFVPGDGMWTHNLIRVELDRALQISAQRRAASKKGHEARWIKTRANAVAMTKELLAQIQKDGGAY